MEGTRRTRATYKIFLIMEAGDDGSMQLIDGKGVFDAAGLHRFVEATKMAACGNSYVVVSIMGPQSSGKSTLLNHMFGTSFKEMVAENGRSQTTQGIWLAKCVDMEPFTIAMYIEGTDGKERGEDDTAFGKQSALFALVVSDVVIINMRCTDIGLEQAANKPLIRTVFQVMIRLSILRKTTLLFVLRDKSKTPLEKLESILKEDIEKIWDNVSKPPALKETRFSDVFHVEVVVLSHYELQLEIFKEEVASLRERFCHSISPGGLAANREGVVPASAFALSAQEMWKVIKKNKDLDLPAHKVMVATIRCEEIVNEKLSIVAADTNWLQLSRASKHEIVPGFGSKLNVILDECLSRYDKEAAYFEEDIRASKRDQLCTRLLQIVRPAYDSIVKHIRSKTLSEFKETFGVDLVKGKEGFADAALRYTQFFLLEFDERVKQDAAIKHVDWNPSETRDNLALDMDAHVASVRATKLNELTERYKACLYDVLAQPVTTRLDQSNDDTWPAIRELFGQQTGSCISSFSSALYSEFRVDKATVDNMNEKLLAYAKDVVKTVAQPWADNVLDHMKNRFGEFNQDEEHMAKQWKNKEEVKSRSATVTAACVKMLSVRAAVRLDDQVDNIENILLNALAGDDALLDSKTWDEVSPVNTLLSPVKCKTLLDQFKEETEAIVKKTIKKVGRAQMSKGVKVVGGLITFAAVGDVSNVLDLAQDVVEHFVSD